MFGEIKIRRGITKARMGDDYKEYRLNPLCDGLGKGMALYNTVILVLVFITPYIRRIFN